MPNFGQRSLNHLATLHPDLQKVLKEAIKYTDFSIICGLRNKEDQNDAFKEGNSKLQYPNSRHNRSTLLNRNDVSDAVDIMPYPIDWDDLPRIKKLAETIKTTAGLMGVNLQWGGDWKNFKDYPHWELKV